MASVLAGVSAIAGIVGLVGGITGKQQASAGASETERLGRENAMLIEAEGKEEERRATEENMQAQAQMRAMSASTGTTGEGSQQIYMTAEQEKFDKDIDWLRQSTSKKADLERRQAGITARSLKSQGKSGLWGSIGGAVGSIGTAYALGR